MATLNKEKKNNEIMSLKDELIQENVACKVKCNPCEKTFHTKSTLEKHINENKCCSIHHDKHSWKKSSAEDFERKFTNGPVCHELRDVNTS